MKMEKKVKKMKQKILYKDGDKLKILKGEFIGEDSYFITILCEQSNYKINKKDIISIKTDKGAENEQKRN
jgi:transcription antitermination factor NusG